MWQHWIGYHVCSVLHALEMWSAAEPFCDCFAWHTIHSSVHISVLLCLHCVRSNNMIKIRVSFEFEWLRIWILCRVFLILSIAVSLLCMATASCLPHVGLWTRSPQERGSNKGSIVRVTVPPAAYCFRTKHGVHQRAGNWRHFLNCPERKYGERRSCAGT